jgi:hypothetical protein
MIQVHPEISIKISCVRCNSSQTEIVTTHLIGVHFVADCKCTQCNEVFYHTLPVGHTLRYPISISKDRKINSYTKTRNIRWIVEPLTHAIAHPDDDNIQIDKKIYRETTDIVILNCLDHLYGHVLLKIFNAQYYLENEKNKGLVLIIPAGFEWLVPEGLAQLWVVHVKLAKTREWYTALDKEFQNEKAKRKKIYVSLAFPSPEPFNIEIERFVKVPKFNLKEFYTVPPKITVIYREDRLWLSSDSLDKIAVVAKEFRIKPLLWILIKIQNIKIQRLLILLKKNIPQVQLAVVGIGHTSKIPSIANDLRKDKLSQNDEIIWCKQYASSNIVIGLHGSNMLLPTALAASYIEILPKSRNSNILQDIMQPYTDRFQHFMGRFVSNKTSPKNIASIAQLIIERYQDFQKSMATEFLEHDLYSDVSKWQQT